MNERTKSWLRKVDRVVRPGAAAMRSQAQVIADAVDALRAATAVLTSVATTLAELAGTEAPAPAGVISALNPRYDEQTVEVIARVLRRDDTALDIGAHTGSVLEHIVAAAPDGAHYAFEPIHHLAEELRTRFPKVQVHEVALAESAGEATFHHVVSNPSYSGLQLRRFDRPHEDVVVTTVRTARLDDIVPAGTAVRFVKIDVEGGELGVLRGGIETIRANRPFVVFEHGLGGSDYYGTRPEMVADLLEGVGLHLNLLDRWLAGQPAIGRTEFVRQFDTNENFYFIAHP